MTTTSTTTTTTKVLVENRRELFRTKGSKEIVLGAVYSLTVTKSTTMTTITTMTITSIRKTMI